MWLARFEQRNNIKGIGCGIEISIVDKEKEMKDEVIDMARDFNQKFKIIKKYIDEYDYYSLLKHGAPNDEFDSYSRVLAEKISAKDSVESIAESIAILLDKAFSAEVNYEKYMIVAEKIRNDISAFNEIGEYMNLSEIEKQRKIGKQLMVVGIIQSANKKAKRGGCSFIERSKIAEWAELEVAEINQLVECCVKIDPFNIACSAAMAYTREHKLSSECYGFLISVFYRCGNFIWNVQDNKKNIKRQRCG